MENPIDDNTVGVALLVSNDYIGQGKELPFVHKDTDDMEQIFKQFRYAVFRNKNVTDEEFLTCYRNLADYNYPPTCKRILLYFSGHGSDGGLVMQNGIRTNIGRIIDCFKIGISRSKTVPQMVKMFFFDACRGRVEDLGLYPQPIEKAGEENRENWMRKIAKEGNTLVAYASTPDHVAYEDSSGHGSRWTKCLVQALEESKENDDVCHVLTSANILMKEQIEMNKPEMLARFQTAEYTSNLTEFVRFKQEATKQVTTPLKGYTKIEGRNCQLVTHYGGKNFILPRDVTTGPSDELIIVDSENQEVIIFDKDVNLIKTFGHGSGDSKLNRPGGVAVDHNANVIAVSDRESYAVKKYSLQGDYLSKFGSYGSGDGEFDHPGGLCFNSKGLLYVVDYSNHRVQVFSDNNVFLFKFGSKGHDPGQFQSPRHIAVDSSDQVYVTDHSYGGGICVFHENGHFIDKINCNNPWAIGITPNDHIITHDDSVLAVFSPTYELVAKFGEKGEEKGQFIIIQGIAINSSGTLFVADIINRHIHIITSQEHY